MIIFYFSPLTGLRISRVPGVCKIDELSIYYAISYFEIRIRLVRIFFSLVEKSLQGFATRTAYIFYRLSSLVSNETSQLINEPVARTNTKKK